MALNPFQQALSDAAHKMGLRGAAEQQIYNSPQYWDIVKQFFGDIQLPAGINESMVTSRNPGQLSYNDPEGYAHILLRNLNGLDPRLGSVSESSTNRPAVLPLAPQQQGQLNNLSSHLNDILMNPVALSTLDPKAMELLAQMKAAEDQALNEQFNRELGTNIAQLVGQGVGSSSIAEEALNRVKQGQGLVKSQELGQQAQRELELRQFLTGQNQQQNQSLQQFIENLLGLGTQRDIASAGNETQRTQIGTQNEQFYQTLQEQIRQFNEQMRAQERQSLWNNVFKGIAAGTGVVSGLAGGGAGLSSLFSGGKNIASDKANYLTAPFNPYATNPYQGVPS
jgi:hypothetical protein